MKSAFLILSVVFVSTFAGAQTKFNGSVFFDVDYKGDMVDMLRSMLPNKQVYHYSEGNFRMETKGGMASGQGDILYIDKTQKTYVMNSSSKKAQEMPQKEAEDNEANVTVTETGETATILGYTCNKYKVVVKMEDAEMTQFVWATKALEPVKPKNANSMGAMASITSKIKGMPLKIQMEIEQMGLSFSMIMTATSLDNKNPSKDLFVIPGDYTVEPFNPKNLIGK